MPVEIRELVIRAKAVEQTPASRPVGVSDEPASGWEAETHAQEALVDACVRKVLDILAARQER